jgi:protein phosphatase 1 regulatory subunit 37
VIRDHLDVVPTTLNSSTFPSQGIIISSPPSSPIPPFTHLSPPSPVTRIGHVLPPQTTHAPYVFAEVQQQQHNLPRSRPLFNPPPPSHQIHRVVLLPAILRQIPCLNHPNGTVHRHDDRSSAALLAKVRALDTLPRLGALRPLDLRGNDLHVSTFLGYVVIFC